MEKAVTPRKDPLILNVLFFLVTLAVGLVLAEGVLRLRNSDQKNYNIEMWRYAKLLKKPSSDPELGHEHIPNAHARLQGVEIRTNSFGMRGPEPDLSDTRKRILLLGSSNTLGWGVAEEDTMAALLQKELAGKAQVFNGGIGNYNAARYVALFEKRLSSLKPDIVVVHYFIRDAETIGPAGGNFLLRNSELAVTLYQLWQGLAYSDHDPTKLVDHYKKMYAAGNPGLQKMEEAMRRLQTLSQERHFKVVVAMVPDIHAVEPYPFTFIHEQIRRLAASYGWVFVDFAGPLSQVSKKELWVMSGDPHMNVKGQKIMAAALLPALE